MSHTIHEKKKILARVRKIRGQLEALERALEADKECEDILHLIAAIRGAIHGLMMQVLDDHILTHVAGTELDEDQRAAAGKTLVDVLRTYLR